VASACQHGNESKGSIKGNGFLDQNSRYSVLKKDPNLWSWIIRLFYSCSKMEGTFNVTSSQMSFFHNKIQLLKVQHGDCISTKLYVFNCGVNITTELKKD
jgi:hypothetical protein